MTTELPIPGRGMGFFKANVAVTAQALERWRRSHAWFAKWPPGLVVQKLEGPLSSGIERLLPFGPGRDRELLWDCGNGDWTAYFDDMPASDAVTAVSGLCMMAGFEGVVLVDSTTVTGIFNSSFTRARTRSGRWNRPGRGVERSRPMAIRCRSRRPSAMRDV